MKETLEGISMDMASKCENYCFECQKCTMKGTGAITGCVSRLAKEVQRLRDEREKIQDVWKDAPENAVEAFVSFYEKIKSFGQYVLVSIGNEKKYIRVVPKTIEQEIAEKYASKLSIITETRENLRDAILQAFEELKEKKK